MASAFQPIIPVWTAVLAILSCTEKIPSPLLVRKKIIKQSSTYNDLNDAMVTLCDKHSKTCADGKSDIYYTCLQEAVQFKKYQLSASDHSLP